MKLFRKEKSDWVKLQIFTSKSYILHNVIINLVKQLPLLGLGETPPVGESRDNGGRLHLCVKKPQ